MEIANTMLTTPYAALPLATSPISSEQTDVVTKEFSAMFFNVLLQNCNLFGANSGGDAMGTGIWNGLFTQQLAQEMAAQHAFVFGGMLFNETAEDQP